VTDEKVARLRAHDGNISRYRRLLKTNLSDLERQYLEQRLSQEKSAVESLGRLAGPSDAGAFEFARATCSTIVVLNLPPAG
jgi:hypothetical protein